MLWVALAALLASPAGANDIPEATRAHLQFLEATAVRLEGEGNTGKQYEKVKSEIARIRREYRLESSSSQPKARTRPNWQDFTNAHTQARAAEEARAQAQRNAEAKARAERARAAAQARAAEAKATEDARAAEELERARAKAKAQAGNPQWEKSKKDFADLAEEELRRRQMYSRYYRTRVDWDYAYKAQMQFAESQVAAGGLGYDFKEADRWARSVLDLQPPAAIAAMRKRYVKALEYVRSPAEQGGLGYVRAYARKAALEQALKSSDAELDKWIAQSRQKVLSERSSFARFKDSCSAWFKEI